MHGPLNVKFTFCKCETVLSSYVTIIFSVIVMCRILNWCFAFPSVNKKMGRLNIVTY
jgi:hypothetical protein